MSTLTSPYKTAVIGCGKRARVHAPGLQAETRLHLAALADASLEAAQAYNAEYGWNAAVYTDYAEMLAREKPEVVVLTLWTGLHLPVILACAEAGVRAVLSEKPMAATWAETQEIARIAESHGLLLTFAHQRRFASGNQAVRAELAAGTFGTIERLDLFSPPHLLDCGTHSVDQALSFHDETPIAWVHGAVDLTTTISYFNVPAEEMFTGVFCFTDGVMASIRTGRNEKAHLDLESGVRVTGTKGFVEVTWDGQIRRARVYDDPAWTFPALESQPDEQMIGVIKNAVDCLESGAEPELSWRKALRAAEALFALYESARRHERVILPLAGVEGNPLTVILEEHAALRSGEAKGDSA